VLFLKIIKKNLGIIHFISFNIDNQIMLLKDGKKVEFFVLKQMLFQIEDTLDELTQSENTIKKFMMYIEKKDLEIKTSMLKKDISK
jgi:hypothetical protein